jgi:hypothetical protein
MQMQQPWLALALAHDAQQREIDRQAREQRAHDVPSPRPSLRRSVGRRVIAIGQRIAAEPSLELVRSR